MHQCHVDAGRSLGGKRANFSREPRTTTHPLSHRAVNPNSLDQQQHSVNPSDGRTDGGNLRLIHPMKTAGLLMDIE